MLSFYLSLVKTEEERSKVEALYDKYRSLIKYKAFKILRDDGLAEDAVHEAFLKIIRHLDGIEEISGHKTKMFIVLIAKHSALDIQRKEKRAQAYNFDDYECSYGVENDIMEKMAIKEIFSIINSLPEIHRDVLLLKVYHDLPDKDIADILGISNQAARKRVQRARDALKKLLAERGGY